jgi:solute carrier family 20 (sodium-dependent phosphate transporter)
MYTWIFVCGILFAFYNAWGGGANDCANSFATSVGSKVLTLKQAIIIASIFEFSGAVLMGSHVTDTVRKKIVSENIFNNDPGALMLGMLCADLSSAIWLTIATYLKWPVSTTHSIIGAIVGFCLVYGGTEAIVWDKIGFIVLSWVISPLLAGIFSFILFKGLKKFVFETQNVFRNTRRIYPVLTFIVFFVNSLFIIYKGSPQLDLDEMPFWQCFLISFGIGTFTAIVSWYFYLPYAVKKVERIFGIEENTEETNEDVELNNINVRSVSYRDVVRVDGANNEESTTDEVNVVESNLDDEIPNEETENVEINMEDNDNFVYDSELSLEENIKKSNEVTLRLRKKKETERINELHSRAFEVDPKSDKLCSWLQIFTSCFSSFSHGSNDVANAVAPLATIFSIYQNDSVSRRSDVPIWILALGGVGIVFGLATWGYKIIDKIGRDLTKISPSRGFIIELAAATTIIIASRSEMPVSTTHCQVGSVVGCGLTAGKRNVKWSLLRGILFSWFITLPITGFLSAALFSWGYYSPSTLTNQTLV